MIGSRCLANKARFEDEFPIAAESKKNELMFNATPKEFELSCCFTGKWQQPATGVMFL